MDLLEFLSVGAHVLGAAIWFGAMAYSLTIVQPRARRWIGDERRYEDFAATLASGARQPVLGLIFVIAASGGAMTAIAGDGRDSAWWVLIAVKAGLLVVALAVFVRQFSIAAVTLTSVVLAGVVLGVGAQAIA